MELNDFSRIEKAVDMNLLKNSNVVVVGAGGSYSLCKALTRSGIGKLTVVDYDTVDESNITRQGYETDQIGLKKVDALGEHLLKISTGTRYWAVPDNFLDIPDEILDLIFGPADIIVFATDSFKAQSYGNIISLRYRKPALWVGYYNKSRCSEIIFTMPGITKACFRCIVGSRYEANAIGDEEIKLEIGFNTIFHSQLLDAQVGLLIMAMLHNKTTGFEFSNFFGESWDRNLLQFKVHPAHSNKEGNLFQRVFKQTEDYCYTFNSVWQSIDADPNCPDCGNPIHHNK